MEKTFTVGRNGYGDPKFTVKVFDDGNVSISEKDPHNGLTRVTIFLTRSDLTELTRLLGLGK